MRPVFLAFIAMLLVSAPWLPTRIAHGQTAAGIAHHTLLARLLDEDKPVFGTWIQYGLGNAFIDAIEVANRNDIDVVVYDMEHNALDFAAMRDFMHLMAGSVGTAKTPRKTFIVRIPATGRELDKNTWMVKQVLDQGAEGVVFPFIETVDQALTAIRAMRYPQPPATPNFTDGIRGISPAIAARYWGLTVPDYMKAADIYPAGDLVPWLMIESQVGIENVTKLARTLKEKNIKAALWAATGDLGASYFGDQQAVAKAVDRILAAGKETGLPVVLNGTLNVEQRIKQGARIFIETGRVSDMTRKAAGR